VAENFEKSIIISINYSQTGSDLTKLNIPLRLYKTQSFVTGITRDDAKMRVLSIRRKQAELRKMGYREIRLCEWEEFMNRLRIMLIGAALLTGGSALASAQPLPRGEVYHDRYERRVDDRRVDDRRVVYRDYRVDHDRRFAIGYRRWDGQRWLIWNGSAWCY
jgi:hypothetical protein